jgi:hypothetical protein
MQIDNRDRVEARKKGELNGHCARRNAGIENGGRKAI